MAIARHFGNDGAHADGYLFRGVVDFKHNAALLTTGNDTVAILVEEGKLSLTLAIGCTGGRHRSVALASALNDYFVAQGFSSVLVNRDIDK